MIISSEFWPQLKEEKMELPTVISKAMDDYTHRFEKLKVLPVQWFCLRPRCYVKHQVFTQHITRSLFRFFSHATDNTCLIFLYPSVLWKICKAIYIFSSYFAGHEDSEVEASPGFCYTGCGAGGQNNRKPHSDSHSRCHYFTLPG